MSSLWAKIFGWAQFGLNAISTVASQPGGLPHSFSGWATLASSLLAAIGIHHASNTNGTN